MLLVVDANTVFSALLMRGKPLLIFELNRVINKFEVVSPEFLFFEIGKRVDKILKFSHFSKEEFINAFSFVKDQIELIPIDKFSDKVEECRKLCPHEKDVPYAALSFKLNCKILSGDKGLKKALPDKVLTPSEAFGILLGRVSDFT